MNILKPTEWLNENKDKYPNGTLTSIIMTAYANYVCHMTFKNLNDDKMQN